MPVYLHFYYENNTTLNNTVWYYWVLESVSVNTQEAPVKTKKRQQLLVSHWFIYCIIYTGHIEVPFSLEVQSIKPQKEGSTERYQDWYKQTNLVSRTWHWYASIEKKTQIKQTYISLSHSLEKELTGGCGESGATYYWQ